MSTRSMEATRPSLTLFMITALVAGMLALLAPPALAVDELGSGDTPATFDPATGLWTVGGNEPFYFGGPGDTPFLGDWDGDGLPTPGLYRSSDGRAYVRDSLDTGVADRDWYIGNPGDTPIVGDWDGDGIDSFGVYRPSEGKVYLSNQQTTAFADVSYYFGGPGDTPFAGDFDGDGIDTVGVFRTSSGQVFLGNEQATGVADAQFYFGNPGDEFIAADWDGDGIDTVGVVRPADDTLYFRNSNDLGIADGQAEFDATKTVVKNRPTRPNIVATASAAGIFGTLLTAATEAGLADTLAADGPFTVFAPTDDAFAALPDGVLDDLLADPDALTEVLLYHVLAGQQTSTSLLTQGAVETLQGQQVIVTEGSAFVNDVLISTPDVLAANGVIHIIDEVLIPPALDIVDTAIDAGTFDTLVTAVQAAGLEGALRGEGPLTVLAPTDTAFDALGAETISALLADPDTLADILLYHVVDGAVPASVVGTLASATTLNGADIYISDNGGIAINGVALVVGADILASNGIIHVLDAVLLPPEGTIVDIAAGNEDLETLVTAVTAADLVETLSGPGPFTVFAPTDAAFAALPEGVLDALLADIPALTDVLLYHVVPGAVTSPTVIGLASATTLNGDVTITVGEGVFVNDAQVVITDIIATNGVIHVIDAVLIPSA